jgi:CRISPR/Cas system-associated endonuclease Cas3-HD
MENDISELIEYLDKKFAKIESVLDVNKTDIKRLIETKADKADIQNLIEMKADKLDIQNLVETKADKADIQNLLDAIDGYAQKADTYFQEMLMLARKVDRHEKWIQQIAKKLGVELEY